MTAPESECAPTEDPFSSTQTLASGLSCLSRIAHASPAGPAPTMTTSYSMTSRSVICCSQIGCSQKRNAQACATLRDSTYSLQPRAYSLQPIGSLRRHPNRAVQADALAVEHDVLAHVRNECGVLLRTTETRREGHLLAERVLRFLR